MEFDEIKCCGKWDTDACRRLFSRYLVCCEVLDLSTKITDSELELGMKSQANIIDRNGRRHVLRTALFSSHQLLQRAQKARLSGTHVAKHNQL